MVIVAIISAILVGVAFTIPGYLMDKIMFKQYDLQIKWQEYTTLRG